MAKRGRKSAASNVVVLVPSARERISPLAPLTKIEAKIFSETVRLNPHLREADGGLLTAYAQTLAKTFRLARMDDGPSIKCWKEAARAALAYARALRVQTLSQVHPETAGRARQNAQPTSYYSRMDDVE